MSAIRDVAKIVVGLVIVLLFVSFNAVVGGTIQYFMGKNTSLEEAFSIGLLVSLSVTALVILAYTIGDLVLKARDTE